MYFYFLLQNLLKDVHPYDRITNVYLCIIIIVINKNGVENYEKK